MKYIILLCSFGFGLSLFGQGFPKERFSYAKMYLLNTKKVSAKSDLSVWRNDRFAFSKIGDGILLDEDQMEDFQKITSEDMSTLEMGLSKCFTPRHGIIFFNDGNEPVASMSICFECEKIALFPNPYETPTKKYDNKKAMKQLSGLKKIVESSNFPVHDVAREYEEIHEQLEYAQDEEEVNHVQPNYADRLLIKPPTVDLVRPKIKLARTARLIEKKPEREVDGKTITLLEQTFYSSKITYQMGKQDWELKYMIIQNPGFLFDNGVTIGMSQEHFMATLYNYTGKKYPKKLTIKDNGRELIFSFESRTLRRIEVKVDQWVN